MARKTTAKFKKGDIVIAKADAPYSITVNGWRGTVKDIRSKSESPDNIWVQSCEDSKMYWVDDTFFTLETSETKPFKFKVGDLVIAKKNAPYGITTNGWIGKITKIKPDDPIDNILVTNWGTSRTCTDWVNYEDFDLYTPSKETLETTPTTTVTITVDKAKEIMNKKTTITNAEAYQILFGIPYKRNSCLTDRCADCPLSSSNGGSCGSVETEWWNKPYKGVFTLIDPSRSPEPKSSAKKIKNVKDNICTAYNKSDLDGLNYIKDNELWENADQYAELEMLLLLNELIFTHNSENYSETAYRIKYYAFLAKLGIGIDENGYAFVKTTE